MGSRRVDLETDVTRSEVLGCHRLSGRSACHWAWLPSGPLGSWEVCLVTTVFVPGAMTHPMGVCFAQGRVLGLGRVPAWLSPLICPLLRCSCPSSPTAGHVLETQPYGQRSWGGGGGPAAGPQVAPRRGGAVH